MAKNRKRRTSKKSPNATHPDIPLELLSEILARLPAKTLLKFRTISKQVKSLIDSPNFISLHLNSYKLTNPPFFLVEDPPSRVSFSSIRCSETFRRTKRLDLPDYFVDASHIGGNYVNGVLLFRVLDSKRMWVDSFILWNPSIRKTLKIHPPDPIQAHHTRVGLGYDSGSHDLKVVLMVCEETPWRDCPGPNPIRVPFPIRVEIYSQKTKSWRRIEVEFQWFKSLRFEDQAVFFNGFIQWIGCDVGIVPYPSYGSHVVAFDVQKEVFSTFGLPDGRKINHSRVLTVMGDSLALLDDYPPGCPVIWVMEKYGVADSWVKRFTISLEYHEFLHLDNRRGELVVVVRQEGVKMYNVESMRVKDLARSYRDRVVFMDAFVESLLLLGESNDNNRPA